MHELGGEGGLNGGEGEVAWKEGVGRGEVALEVGSR